MKPWNCVRINDIWWHHNTETFSALLILFEGNPLVTGGFSHKGPIIPRFVYSVLFWTSCSINSRVAIDLRCHDAHIYEITVPTTAESGNNAIPWQECDGDTHEISKLRMYLTPYFDGLVQDCSNPIALARGLLQSCTYPFISLLYITQDCGNPIALAMGLRQSCTKPLISLLYITPLCPKWLHIFLTDLSQISKQ